MLIRLKIIFLKWQIRLLLPNFHLAKNSYGGGRKKKNFETVEEKALRVAEVLDGLNK